MKLLPVKYAILLPEVQPEYVSLLASGLTAAISLEKVYIYAIISELV